MLTPLDVDLKVFLKIKNPLGIVNGRLANHHHSSRLPKGGETHTRPKGAGNDGQLFAANTEGSSVAQG